MVFLVLRQVCRDGERLVLSVADTVYSLSLGVMGRKAGVGKICQFQMGMVY